MLSSKSHIALSVTLILCAQGCRHSRSAGGEANAATQTQGASPAEALTPNAIAITAMELRADRAAGPGFCIPASLAADGSITVEERVAGRFVGNRLLDADGSEIFRIEANSVVVPWNPAKNLTIDADGSLRDDRGAQYTVAATGVPSMRGEAGRCRVVNYQPAQLRTAVALFIAPMMLMARALHARTMAELDAGAPAAAPVGPARLRLVHASAAPTFARVAVNVDDAPAPPLSDLAYGARSDFYATQSGSRMYGVFTFGHTDSASRLMNGSTPELSANKSYTAVLASVTMGGQATPTLVVDEDVAPPPAPEGRSQIAVFNAVTGSGNIDVCAIQGGFRRPSAAIAMIQEGAWSDPRGVGADGHFMAVETAALQRLQLRVHDDRECQGASLGTVRVPELGTDRQYSLVVMGDRTGRPRIQVLACPRDAGRCELVAAGRP